MRITSLLFFIIFIINLENACFAAAPAELTYTGRFNDTIHPVIPGDFPDPTVIRAGNIYYAAGTSSEWAPQYPLFKSTDLVHWKQAGYIFNKTPDWASSSFWAPELLYRNGIYYVYYTARKKADGISCIGVATTDNPEKGFTDRGIILEHGKEAIDAFVVEEKGEWYITFKAYGLDDRPIELLGYRLSKDGLKIMGEPFMLLRDEDRKGLEGQCIVKRNGYYYLFYSAGNCCGIQCSYHVNVARAASIKGPYIKYEHNPVVDAFDGWKCTGHGTIVTDKNGSDYYLFHAYNKAAGIYTGRQGMLARLSWDKLTGWPSFHYINGETVTGFNDYFSGSTLNDAWQWDFRNTTPAITCTNGQLSLSGKITPGNKTGTALTIRPAKENYEITTSVTNHNGSLKGLVIYGDIGQSAGIGVKGDTIEVWSVKNNLRNPLKTIPASAGVPIYLKMDVINGYRVKFYWSSVSGTWNEVVINKTAAMGDDAAPWDRSPRPGLLQMGSEPAAFDYFRIQYHSSQKEL